MGDEAMEKQAPRETLLPGQTISETYLAEIKPVMQLGRYKPGDEAAPGYRLTQFLGRGGFGEVWKATAPGGTEAALKIISLSGKQGLKEFQALRLVKRIRHPNLVPLVAYWLKDESGSLLDESAADIDQLKRMASGQPTLQGTMAIEETPTAPTVRPAELLIAMGLGERDLFSRLQECQKEGLPGIPQTELLGYLEDSARAIDFLNSPRHDLGAGLAAVQHCDIKPFNIMIVGGAAQVCDFGLARMLGDVRATATAAGTLAYIAPECLANGEPSATTDQYSLAITYIELKTGKLPYESDNFNQVMSAVLNGRLNLSGLPPAEQEVIRRATAIDPTKRFASSVEMVQALRRAGDADGNAVQTKPAPRSRWPALAGAGTVAIAALLGGWWWWAGQNSINPGPIEIAAASGQDDPAETELSNTNDGDEQDEPRAVDSDPPDPESDPGEPADPEEPADTPAIDADAKAALASLAQAKTELESHDPDAALLALGTAVERLERLSPKEQAEVYLTRGTCYLEQERYSEAADDLTKAIELSPDARGYSRRATIRLRQDEFESAVSDYTAAIEIQPDARDYASRGLAWSLQGNSKSAVADYTKAIQLDSDYGPAYFSRGLEFVDLGKYAEAIPDFEYAASLPPKDPQVKLELARLLATAPDSELRNGPRAKQLAEEVVAASKSPDALALDVLACALAEVGDFKAAQERAAQAIAAASNPDFKEQFEAHLALFEKDTPFHLSSE